MTTTTDQKTRLDAAISDAISDAYRRHDAGLLSREPSLSVTYLVDLMAITGSVLDFFPVTRRYQRRLVQASCDRLVRAGKLVTSLGVGDRGGAATMYEPSRTDTTLTQEGP